MIFPWIMRQLQLFVLLCSTANSFKVHTETKIILLDMKNWHRNAEVGWVYRHQLITSMCSKIALEHFSFFKVVRPFKMSPLFSLFVKFKSVKCIYLPSLS